MMIKMIRGRNNAIFVIFIFYSDVLYAVNWDIDNIYTPVDPCKLLKLLQLLSYPPDETKFLVDGFTKGFSIQYNGPTNRQSKSANIPFREGIGSKLDMWNKIMTEVMQGNLAGPFEHIPYKDFIQSPIGLVPKAGNKTRLIFHLSYSFGKGEESLNYYTPPELCSVNYPDLDHAGNSCLNISSEAGVNSFFLAKMDLMSAFRVLPIQKDQWCWLIMKAEDPRKKGSNMYFVNKVLPFGSSISCSLYQRFSNGLRHLVEYFTGGRQAVTNYLDDFLFVQVWKSNVMQW